MSVIWQGASVKKIVKCWPLQENKELTPWVKSIVNHVWYCAKKCRDDPELINKLWTLILHVQRIKKIHSFDGDKYFDPRPLNQALKRKLYPTLLI